MSSPSLTSLKESRNGILNYTDWHYKEDPHEYAYIHNPTDLCMSNEVYENLFLLILVASHPENVRRRYFIRKTWGSQSLFYASSKTRTVFLLGRDLTSNHTTHNQVTQEFLYHNDILQEDFVDTYLNLTIKSIMGLKWVSRFCPKATFVMKTDDDMLINIDRLLAYLQRASTTSFFGGKMAKTTVIRDYDNKFFVPRSVYPKDVYPPYCEGLGYLMSYDVVHKLYFTSLTTPLFPWEDVYIGMLLTQLPIKLINIPNFFAEGWYFDENDRIKLTRYAISKLRACFTFHSLSQNEMFQIWEMWRKKPVQFPQR